MSRLIESHRSARRRPRSFESPATYRRTAVAGCKLDSSAHLIAPVHSFRLPSLQAVRTRFRFFAGTEPALPMARSLIDQKLLQAKHFETASSVVEVMHAALTGIVSSAFGDSPDQFSIELGIVDGIDEYRKPQRNVVFFVWNNTADPQYIPLRPIYERLNGNPRRDELMASLYLWLYRTAARVFEPFGFVDAEQIYHWRRDAYISEREAGEDVDLEGEVESADPAKVANYIRHASKLRLKTGDIPEAIASITDSQLRHAFQKACAMYRESRSIRLPAMSNECAQLAHDAAYYMESSPLPALGISHWRDDPIVAWFDEFCRDQFESGETPRAPILLCFHPRDTSFFLKIVKSLPRMARTAASLGEWVRFAEELENASHYSDREDSGLSPETGDTHL